MNNILFKPRKVLRNISHFAFEFLLSFRLKVGESKTVRRCEEMKKEKAVKTIQNGGSQESQSRRPTASGIYW